jgi:hypothetical protein
MSFYVGLDLGRSVEYTALAVVEYVNTRNPKKGDRFEQYLHLRHLERYPLRTPYQEVAGKVARLMRSSELISTTQVPGEPTVYHRLPELIVDTTAVGRAVTDLLKSKGLWFKSVTLTGSDVARYSVPGSIPRKDVIAALEVPFHTGELRVAEGLELWPVLRSELQAFRRKVKLGSPQDPHEHWRESEHDDLVLATALACWYASRKKGLPAAVPKPKVQRRMSRPRQQ